MESYENLDQLDRDLIALEQDPANRETLASVFRTIHTIKGTCGFLGFDRLGALTHAGENLLSRLRAGELALTRARADVLLTVVDTIRVMLADIEENEMEADEDHAGLIGRLTSLTGDDEAIVDPPLPPPARPALSRFGRRGRDGTRADCGTDGSALRRRRRREDRRSRRGAR